MLPVMKGNKMASLFYLPIVVVGVLLQLTSMVSGHGRLIEPPSRSSMWRFGFKTKPNYNDNELFCGGYTVHWQRNGGKCGVCGDAWDMPKPRPNEAGGIYGRGIIVRSYKPGQVIKSTVEITANHRGFFEFKLCPHNDPSTEVTQDCLDSYPLQLADGYGTKYYPSAGTGGFSVQLKLPEHLTCSQCVFQWTYTAGNNWGRCDNGTSKVGCGPQETFRGCADVAVGDVETNDIMPFKENPKEKQTISAIPSRRTTQKQRYRPRLTQAPASKPSTRRPYYNRRPISPITTRKPYSRRTRPTRPSKPTQPTPYRPLNTRVPLTKKPRPTYKARPTYKVRPTYKPKTSPKKVTNIETEGNDGGCKAVGVWASISGIASWCDTNCARGYCPSSHCDCS
ncbi:chitin-binding type-4 domain-containing protein [Caerostris extrusa]|uniref:Chitin-binding type-4 domain-containing protein n=1 Tax=Caerostris extrusa TaxID=172846 RepID=A0AAV4X1U6_CAEEX|nr:chitin-binding type-4 domain-containing protein [Caerostris extrusa]